MRWLPILFAAALVYGATIKRECSLDDFGVIAYSTHNPKERNERITSWLDESGPSCTKEQLVKIQLNLAQALGTADTIEIRAKLGKLYERAK